MRYVCMILGFLTGKWKVKCVECASLDGDGKCYGHKMPDEVVNREISCGFWRPKK